MLSIADVLDAIPHSGWADWQTLERGQSYADSGRVLEHHVQPVGEGLILTGEVLGTQSYRVLVHANRAGHRVNVKAFCDCPVGSFCKHAAALLMVAGRDEPGPSEEWRRSLDAILDGVPRANTAAPAATTTPVAIQIVAPPPPRRRGYASTSNRRPRLAVRPVRMGASGRWVKTGFGWRDLPSAGYDERTRYDPAALDLLVQLQLALQAGRSYWSSGSDMLDLQSAGMGLWPLLRRATAMGLPLVCSEPSMTIELADVPAAPQLDLRRGTGRVLVNPGVLLDQTWWSAEEIDLIGAPQPPHGAILWGEDGFITLAALEPRPTGQLLSWLTRGDSLSVPEHDIPELLTDYLPRVRGTVTTGSSDGSVTLPDAPTVRLKARLIWESDASARLTWRWSYGAAVEGSPASERSYDVESPATSDWGRQPAAEHEILERANFSPDLTAFLDLGRNGEGTWESEQHRRGVEAMEFATGVWPELRDNPAIEVAVSGDPPEFREATGAPVVRFASSADDHREDKTDWLDLEVVVSIDDDKHGTLSVGLADVLAALARDDTRVMLRHGVYVDLDRPELDQLARLVADARELTEQPRDKLRLSRDQHDLLAEVEDIGPTEGQVTQWVRAAAALRDLAATEPPPDPAWLTATLRPYQRDGYQWLTFLHEHGLGGVLADDMGLGKTVQTLAMIARARELSRNETEENGADPAPPFLVVAPSSVVGTWVSEVHKFTPELRVVPITESRARRGWSIGRVTDPDFPADIVVTTYTLLRLEAQAYEAQPWSGLVLDEAQMVKNHRSKTYAAARAIDAGSRFAITGTPMENNLMELWSVLSLAAPGLFPYAARFKDRFAKPIEQGQDPDTLAALRRRVHPVMLRRTKDLVAADLPEKQEQVLEVELSPKHRKIYDTHLQRERQRILKLLDDLDENRISILASLTRLRQLSLDPALVDSAHEDVGSAKLDALVEHLVEISAEGHRALVFSQFTGFLARVRARLDAAGIAYSYLDGSTRKRAEVIDGFKAGDAPVFLISLKAGGVGLTLTEADYCFLLDPWWNPAVENQAVDRAHRIGQTRNVVVYRMVSAGTIEQKVMELAQRKAELFKSVLDADSMTSAALTADDIAGLLDLADRPLDDPDP